MGFFNAPKFPSIGELFKAKGAPKNSNVPAPMTLCSLELRLVLLVVIGISAVLTAAQIFLLIGFIWNPFYLILFIFAFINLLVQLFGFFSVFRLVPEWMVAYGYIALLYLFIDAIWVVAYAIGGNVIGSLITYALKSSRLAMETIARQRTVYRRVYAMLCHQPQVQVQASKFFVDE
ncbi:hypothetical protein HDU97_005256 [Phlyctochytrium planicorne]|nr:hypothetical protein HDU97_005256 [Phlyctochytrium planicorne]